MSAAPTLNACTFEPMGCRRPNCMSAARVGETAEWI